MNNGRLKDKIAIVTGSTSGIGKGIARVLAKEGARVIITGRNENRAEGIIEEIKGFGGKASYHFLDITKPETVTSLMEDTAKEYGKIDILVNNAANVTLKDGSVEELDIKMWDDIMDSDLRSVFIATKAVLPYMKEAKAGSIINIGSMAAFGGDLGATAYAAAKAGVELLTKYTALQYGKDNIRCNCVRPGLIVTPENEDSIHDDLKKVFLDNILVNRYGKPEDIGYMVAYLGSDESGYVSGQVFDVDGGINSHMTTTAQFRNLGGRTW